jgi:exopolyphosphatase/guanosine-5'-triphosphate,3'-diphosphate pyrophosphatase
VLLHRSRDSEPLPHIDVQIKNEKILLRFPQDWLAGHPLTKLDLEQEAQHLSELPLVLKIDK